MKRSKFSLSYTHLFSCDMGELIPCGLTEVLPGDSIQMQTRALIRCAPMLAPPMHPVRVRIHHWYVPHRLVWEDFEEFITGGPDGLAAPTFPTRNIGTASVGTLIQYLGVPAATYSPQLQISVLPLRAYNLIWNEFYRDQDLQTPLTNLTSSTSSDISNTTLQTCAWEKDYFTSARPWEQKGPAVSIPLGSSAPVDLIEVGPPEVIRNASRSSPAANSAMNVNEAGGAQGMGLFWRANLTGATSVTVASLRQSLAIQRFEEARAMYGSRYPEYLRALGVRSSDARLSRPEYLGGGVQTIQFSEVLQTAADGANPVSTLRGHGISALRSNRFRRFIEEHGYILTLLSVVPKTIYMNGLFRTWNRRTKFDFWQKELENLGQQAILNKEVRALHASPNGTFGYQDRYDDYRRSESRVSGEFAQSSLNYWHFARDFATDPTLNSSFVAAVPPERPFAAPSADVLYVHCQHSIQARRLLSKRMVPKTF